MKLKRKPSRDDVRALNSITRQIGKLNKKRDDLERSIIEKRCPCKPGDIIDTGKDRGVVVLTQIWPFGWSPTIEKFKVEFYPIRGNRRLRNRRYTFDMDSIKVIEPKSERTLAILNGH